MIVYIAIFVVGLIVGWWGGWKFALMGVKENLKNGNLIWTGRNK